MVRCIHGANEENLPIAGRPVAWARRNLVDSLNIPPRSKALLDGVPVREDQSLEIGQSLEFLDPIGHKGVESPSEFRPGDACPDLLTEEQAIRYLRLDEIDIKNPEETLRRYRKEGYLRGTQVSKRVYYLRSELDALLKKLTDINPR